MYFSKILLETGALTINVKLSFLFKTQKLYYKEATILVSASAQ